MFCGLKSGIYCAGGKKEGMDTVSGSSTELRGPVPGGRPLGFESPRVQGSPVLPWSGSRVPNRCPHKSTLVSRSRISPKS